MKVSVADVREAAREIVQHMREVREILNGGVRFADQMQVRTFRWSSTTSPVLVGYQGKSVPVALLALAVRDARRVTDAVVSGVPLTWTASRDGALVSDVGGTTPGVEYDVTVLVVEG